MGNKSSQIKQQDTERQHTLNEHYYDEVVEVYECCGFERRKIIKKGLIWEDNLMVRCDELEMCCDWVHDIQEVAKELGRKLPRRKFIDEFNSLKSIQVLKTTSEKEILLSPSEIDDFKVNLKNSVLLSYGQALKPPRPKENSKIESVMLTQTAKSGQKNVASSYHTATRSERKRSDIYAEQFRKESILKERERTIRQSYSKNGMRDSIMSFVDDTMSSLFRGQDKEISKQSSQALEIFVKFSLILEKHLNNKENIITMIIESFQQYIYKKYKIFNSKETKDDENSEKEEEKEVTKTFKTEELEQKLKTKIKKERFKQLDNRKSLTIEEIDELIGDIRIFLDILRDVVEDYYKTSEFAYEDHNESFSQNGDVSISYGANTNFLISNSDNILILVTAILFKNEKFYTHIFNIFKKFHEKKEYKLKNILTSLKNTTPDYFQIKKEYCLNDLTIGKNNQIEEEDNIKTNKKLTEQKIEQETSMSEKSTSFHINKPYFKCKESLNKLIKSKTPTAKMKTIMECSEKITESVAQFYKDNQLEIKNEVLDADQILSIFCYILSLNPVENLHSHLYMIEHFATENQMISITGYYYSVLTCALEQLENTYSSTVADKLSEKNESFSQSNKSNKSKQERTKSNANNMKKEKSKRSFRNN